MTSAAAQPPGTTLTLHPGTDGTDGTGLIQRTVLPSGLRIVTETIPTARSAAFGIWAGIGSRDEPPAEAGATHFLEHLLFKGTHRRTAQDISIALDSVGGELNALTAKEYTCFHAHVLGRDLPFAVDLLSDMVTASLITDETMESERGVILEEIAMRDDDPVELVQDEWTRALLGDTPMGRSVFGAATSVGALTRDTVARYHQEHYKPPNLVAAAAGNLDHDGVVELVTQAFTQMQTADAAPAAPRVGGTPARTYPAVRVIEKDTEQVHLVLGGPGLPRADGRRFALDILNSALGGSMASRLFQQIRERRGLAYSIYSYTHHYADTGTLAIYAGCRPDKTHEVLEICRDEITKAIDGITAQELVCAKGQVSGALLLGQEDINSRMGWIGKGELVHPQFLPVHDVASQIESVTLDEVRGIAAELLPQVQTLLLAGPLADLDLKRATAMPPEQRRIPTLSPLP
jgi:predicted Zn-dependent peptidase